MIRNKIKVDFFVEDGCSQDEGEASSHWQPINFAIYSELFPELIQEAIDEWLHANTIAEHTAYEVIFAHVIEQDGGGAVLGEHFEPIYTESCSL
ncbi:MAG: hypothetical protein GY941_30860 [Planctomycetes bacterium]|nr:hypothetical protein [Planctomycetota bacterium]